MTRVEGRPLSSASLAGIASGRDRVHFASTEAPARSFALAAETAQRRPLYGRSTGVGANRSVPVTAPATFAVGLLRSHATSAGPPRAAPRVRAMLAVRLNQLAAGGSGADPALLDALAAMIDADALPPVLELGGIGTGDLPALARTALTLMGELPATAPVPVRYDFGAADALPFLSSNAATVADAALSQDALAVLARSALAVAALTHRAVRGGPEAFSHAAEAAVPFPGARAVCQVMRRTLASQPGSPPARIQDPYGLRALPAVHGAFLDALGHLDAVVTACSAAPSENPVVLPGVGVAHHGAFHAAALAQALDTARSALAQSAQLSTARLALLMAAEYTGLSPFLAESAGASGMMIAEYVGASALGAVRALAAPAAVQSVTLSRGTEDDASFASLAAAQALAAVEGYRTVLACELVAAVRALRMHGEPVAGELTQLPDGIVDRDLTADIGLAEALLETLAR